jgi:hypothetical protein
MSESMAAAVFHGYERITLDEVPMPACGPTDAVVIEEAYELFGNQRDDVVKVALEPSPAAGASPALSAPATIEELSATPSGP